MTVTQINKGPVTGNSDSESRGQIQGSGDGGGWVKHRQDALHDPRLVKLTDQQHRAWSNCLLMADSAGVLPQLDDVACHLRLGIPETGALLLKLYMAGLLARQGDIYSVRDWERSHRGGAL